MQLYRHICFKYISGMLISNIITIFFFYRANFEKSGIPFFHVFDHTSFVNALHVTLVWPWGHRSIYVFLKHWMGNTTIWGRYWYELIYWSSVSVGPDLRIFLISFNSIFFTFSVCSISFQDSFMIFLQKLFHKLNIIEPLISDHRQKLERLKPW